MKATRITTVILALTSALAQFPLTARAVAPQPAEFEAAAEWAAAKFRGTTLPRPTRPGLIVLANHDPVQLNSRNGRALRLGNQDYTNGLYCHAFSQILVRLPSPAARFSELAGVDSNDQTSGGRGSVRFSVHVGGSEEFKTVLVREGMNPIPINVDLNGASEFRLQVDDGGDGISCDQADWANAAVTLLDGKTLSLADLPLRLGPEPEPTSPFPHFAFTYDGVPSSAFLTNWTCDRQSSALDPNRTRHTLTWTDPKTALQVRCVAIQYADFPTLEWTVYFKNTGTIATPILSDILALDATFDLAAATPAVLHHNKGTFVRADDFEPLTTPLEPGRPLSFAPPAGRPCGHVWPYFNLDSAGQGLIVAVGWPGQWSAQFTQTPSRHVRTTAGQQLTRLRLHPGEEIRTPLIVLQFWNGDWVRSQNIWRRWMIAHSMPRPNNQPPKPLLTPCSSHQFAEMIKADEASQILFINRYLEEKLNPDYWWMDAGWYVNQSGWPNTGTWLVDSNRFPRGLRAISDHAHQRGLRTILWFEPERVTAGTWLAQNHPEWLLKGTLLNLGNPAAREWLTEHVDKTLTEQGIDLYRQDYNIDPLNYWRDNDTEDRQGITENHYIAGYLAFWDGLRQRRPGLLIDSCASGGHRNDLETMRRSLPFLRSDHILNPVGNQAHTYGLSLWLPYHGTGTGAGQFQPYELRSNLACPHVIACWDVRDTSLNYELLRQTVAQWRAYADNYLGDYYPLTPYSLADDAWLAWQFDRPEQQTGMIHAFRRSNSIYESARFKIQGLNPETIYRVTNIDHPETPQKLTGRELADPGFLVQIPTKPGAAIITYKASEPVRR